MKVEKTYCDECQKEITGNYIKLSYCFCDAENPNRANIKMHKDLCDVCCVGVSFDVKPKELEKEVKP